MLTDLYLLVCMSPEGFEPSTYSSLNQEKPKQSLCLEGCRAICPKFNQFLSFSRLRYGPIEFKTSWLIFKSFDEIILKLRLFMPLEFSYILLKLVYFCINNLSINSIIACLNIEFSFPIKHY